MYLHASTTIVRTLRDLSGCETNGTLDANWPASFDGVATLSLIGNPRAGGEVALDQPDRAVGITRAWHS